MFGGERNGKKETKRKKREKKKEEIKSKKRKKKRKRKEKSKVDFGRKNRIFPSSSHEKNKNEREREREREKEKEKKRSSASLYDLHRSGRRFSSKQEEKFIYATRASHRYKNLGFSPNSKRLGFLSHCDAPKPGGPLTTRQPAEYS